MSIDHEKEPNDVPPATREADAHASGTQRLFAKLFRPFAKVQPSEVWGAAMLTITVFLLLTSYYLLKTAREPLILLHGGAEVKSYASAGQAILMVVMLQAYGALAKRVGRMKLIAIVYLFFASNLFVFAPLTRAGASIGIPFYLWVGVFNYTAIAQFWSFAADVYTPEQGKRLFALVGIGSSVGAVFGAWFAKLLAPLGPAGLMAVAGALLVVCVVFFFLLDRRLPVARSVQKDGQAREEPLGNENAFKLLIRDKYLMLTAALTFLLNWVNSNGEYVLDKTLVAAVDHMSKSDAQQFVIDFKAGYFFWVNVLGVLLQMFAVSRILTKFGVRNALLVTPAISFLSYAFILFTPVLGLIRVAKVVENSFDYSLQSTARQALFLVTSRVEKYVGKTTVDTLIVRLGDIFSAVVVWVAITLHWPVQVIALLNLVVIVLWIVLIFAIGRENTRRAQETPEEVAMEPHAA